jgi:protease stability complex PrcB-like protein
LNAQRWLLRQQNNLHAQSERLNSILGWSIILTLFVLFLNISPSEARDITKSGPLSELAAGQTRATPTIEVSFQTVAKGYRSGVREPLQIVARNQTEWDALWKRHVSIETNPGPTPSINFTKEIVVGLFLGEKPTGGYAVEIIRVEKSHDTLVIYYREKNPLPGSIATQALTQPFNIINVAGESNLRVTFRRTS